MPWSVVSVAVDDSDPRDPAARCDRCGALGTIARAIRHTDPPLILRYFWLDTRHLRNNATLW